MEYILPTGVFTVLGLIITFTIRGLNTNISRVSKDVGEVDDKVDRHESRIAVLEHIAKESKEFRGEINQKVGNIYAKIDSVNNYVRDRKK